MSSSNYMLSGSEIATNTGTNVCDDYAKIFHYENPLNGERYLVFQVDPEGVLFA